MTISPAASRRPVHLSGIIPVTDATFADVVLASPIPVLVDFWAVWCPPCRVMVPVLERLAADYEGRLTVASLNVDEEPLTARANNVLAMPTLQVYRDGRLVTALVGARSGSALRKVLDDVL
jgi:thioredoxin 1